MSRARLQALLKEVAAVDVLPFLSNICVTMPLSIVVSPPGFTIRSIPVGGVYQMTEEQAAGKPVFMLMGSGGGPGAAIRWAEQGDTSDTGWMFWSWEIQGVL